MHIIGDISELPAVHHGSFVPTMGALHDGHLSLIRRAAALAQPVVVSIFVNPTQFAPGEDYQQYPRDLDQDADAAERAGATVLFAPAVETIYPPGDDVAVPDLPPVATEPKLEDHHRPGHFAGVCQVVARLFDLVCPAVAVFGEKDYQQLLVIKQMVEQMRAAQPDRWGELVIEAVATGRASDGLALSSRNAYLNHDQRQRALGLSRALESARALLAESADAVSPREVESLMHTVLAAHHLQIDYAVVRDAQTLLPIDDLSQAARALIAAHVDSVRLIDNAALS